MIIGTNSQGLLAMSRDCKNMMLSFCVLGHMGSKPTSDYCNECDDYAGKPRGAGDFVELTAKHLGLDKLAKKVEKVTGKNCGCQERRKKLNKLIPFRAD